MKNTMLEQKKHNKFHITMNVIVFFVCIVLSIYFLINAYQYQEEKTSFFKETSNVDYKVYLNENAFYEKEYLDKDMLYVASLIDYIKINFDYSYKIDTQQDIEFIYNIIGKLVISDKNGKKVYLEKTYPLLKDKSTSMIKQDNMKINETLKIDYSYYNSLANNFKTSYGIDTESKLIVYMTISKKNLDDTKPYFDTLSAMNVDIPLSKKSVEIALDYKDINNSDYIVNEESKTIVNPVYIIISTILIISAIVIFIKTERKIIKLINKYDKHVKKILKEYDRLIVESSNKISFENKDIINLEKFTELLDVHDNLQLPILYNVEIKNKKCYFYINHENIIYLHTIKSSDFEEQNEKK